MTLLWLWPLTTSSLQDPILRFGGMFAVGLAYRGTDNNAAIQRLLRYAVTDVSDDVRRAAVMNLGFVLLGVPDQCPAIVSQLARSYNAHLRYGAAMAVGIACAGTGALLYSHRRLGLSSSCSRNLKSGRRQARGRPCMPFREHACFPM